MSKLAQAYAQVNEKKKAKKDEVLDDGDGMDPVGQGDADIDNDGDVDKSDEYLTKRRKAISKNMKKESVELDEMNTYRVQLPDRLKTVQAKSEKDALNKAMAGMAAFAKRDLKTKIATGKVKAKVVKEEAELDEATKYGIIRYPDTAISYVKNTGKGWEHMYDPSYGFKGKVDSKDMKHMSSIDPTKIPSRLMKNESLDEDLEMVKKEKDPKGGYIVTLKDKKGKLIKRHMKNGKVTDIDESVNESKYGTQAQRLMSPLQKARQDKEKSDRDRDGKLKSTALPMRKKKNEEVDLEELTKTQKRALQNVKAKPKDKVSLKKAPWDKKEDVSEGEGETTQCPKCEGSTENHSADCPTQKETKAKDDTAVVSPKAESKKWTVYKRIMEKTRAAQTAGATAPEEIDSKESEGSKEFAAAHDTPPSDVSDVEKAIEKNLKTMSSDPIKHAPLRAGDNKAGDLKADKPEGKM